jgi:hypothetical protein
VTAQEAGLWAGGGGLDEAAAILNGIVCVRVGVYEARTTGYDFLETSLALPTASEGSEGVDAADISNSS